MIVERFIIKGGDNYNYLIISDKGKNGIVIDPLDVEQLQALALKNNVTITHILITHGHNDHTSGARQLAEETGAVILGHKDIDAVGREVNDGEKFSCETISVQAIETPGHTFDSFCYLIEDMLFTGDTVFFSGAGNCHSGDVESLYISFSTKITTLADSIKIYPGHEYTKRNLEFALSIEPENGVIKDKIKEVIKNSMPLSTIGDEKIYNPFFRFANDMYREALEIKMNHIINDPKEVFLLTRELRNRW